MSLALADWLLATNAQTPSGLKFYHFGQWVHKAEPSDAELIGAYLALANQISLDDLVFITVHLLRSMRMEYFDRFLSAGLEDDFPFLETETSQSLTWAIEQLFSNLNVAEVNQEIRLTQQDLATA